MNRSNQKIKWQKVMKNYTKFSKNKKTTHNQKRLFSYNDNLLKQEKNLAK